MTLLKQVPIRVYNGTIFLTLLKQVPIHVYN